MTVNGPGFSIIPEELLDLVSDHAYKLYGLLARYVGSNESAWPYRRTLAERMKCSDRSLGRAMQELVAVGYLRVEPRLADHGGHISNDYYLTTPRPSGGGKGGVKPTPPPHPRPPRRTPEPSPLPANLRGGPATGAGSREGESITESQKHPASLFEPVVAAGDAPESPPPAAKASKPKVPKNAAGEALLREWWESRNPRPVIPPGSWPQATRTIGAFLDSGWSPDAVRAALDAVGSVSANALNIKLNAMTQRENLRTSERVY